MAAKRTISIFDCSVCGRPYSSTQNYKDGSKLVIHKSQKLLKPFPHMAVVDGCFIPADKRNEPVSGIGMLGRSRSNGRF